MDEIIELLKNLIAFHSITPDDYGCQNYLISYLQKLGFTCYSFDNPPVNNFFAFYGSTEPLLVFAGHTDVVSPGDLAAWKTNPFELAFEGDIAYGRGVADMKGSIAAMLVAARKLVEHGNLKGGIGLLITSGEEGDHYHLGTPYVMGQIQSMGILPKYCIVGEPSSASTIGDVIKVGRRGSLNGSITLKGKQGHVAYPHLACNPIHLFAPVLQALINLQLDDGNEYFPPSQLQVTSVSSGGHGNNVIPGELSLKLNCRFSPLQSEMDLRKKVENCFEQYQLQTEISWRLSGNPFLTSQGRLLEATVHVIEQSTGKAPLLSTSGGTSDGRFIAPYGVEVIELGPVNATIHQVNECVSLQSLYALAGLYFEIGRELIA
jgi:succinyl-diaminopimelate desuccinylase